MIYIFPILFVLSGYILGWLIRYVMSYVSKPVGSCNIVRNGRIGRALLGCLLIGVGLYTGGMFWYIAGGFTLYESRAKWCIARAIIK